MGKLELFHFPRGLATKALDAALHTPLGEIGLAFTAGALRLAGYARSGFDVAEAACVLMWDDASVRAEIILASLVADLLEGMVVHGSQKGDHDLSS